MLSEYSTTSTYDINLHKIKTFETSVVYISTSFSDTVYVLVCVADEWGAYDDVKLHTWLVVLYL